jgi:hypothetical protein
MDGSSTTRIWEKNAGYGGLVRNFGKRWIKDSIGKIGTHDALHAKMLYLGFGGGLEEEYISSCCGERLKNFYGHDFLKITNLTRISQFWFTAFIICLV